MIKSGGSDGKRQEESSLPAFLLECQRTRLHTETEKLCLLGMATKEMMILTPDPAIWVSLPGGMPYFRVEKEKQTDMSSVY